MSGTGRTGTTWDQTAAAAVRDVPGSQAHWPFRPAAAAAAAARITAAHAAGKLSWVQVEAAVIDAIDQDEAGHEVRPQASSAIADAITAALGRAGIAVRDDKPRGATIAEICRIAGLRENGDHDAADALALQISEREGLPAPEHQHRAGKQILHP